MSALPTERSKNDLRTSALAKRDALSSKRRTAAAETVAKRGLPFEILRGTVVSGYSPIRSEIDPVPLMRTLAAQGAIPERMMHAECASLGRTKRPVTCHDVP